MLKDREREMYERLLKERDRLLDAMIEQVEYLRGRLASLGERPLMRVPTPDEVKNQSFGGELVEGPDSWYDKTAVTEEEEELAARRAMGLITDSEMAIQLEQLGFDPNITRN